MKNLRRIRQSGKRPTLSQPLCVLDGVCGSGTRRAPVHMHAALELGVVVSGVVRREFAGFKTQLHPGQLWWAGCWEPHAGFSLRPRTVVVGFVFLPEAVMGDPFREVDWLGPFLAAPADRPQLLDRRDRQQAVQMAGAALSIARRRAPGWQTTAWIELHRLICLAWRRWNRRPDRTVGERAAAARVAPAIRLIRDRLPESVRLHEAARACGMSRCRLATAFTSAMGISFAKFALRTRLSAAVSELCNGDDSLRGLAARWGFTDASHFHRVFTRHYGCTPGDFRARPAAPSKGDFASSTHVTPEP